MAQHDFDIDNQTAPAFRTDLNNALEALATLSSGATEPTTTYPNMLWYDSANNLLKMRTEADDAWIVIGTLNQSTNTFEVANLTELTQGQAEDDTDTTFGLVSGERLGQAVAANEQQIGVGQTWQDVSGSRSSGTTYQNTTGKPIQVSLNYQNAGNENFQISSDGSTFLDIAKFDDDAENFTGIVPNNHYYRTTGGSFDWFELR